MIDASAIPSPDPPSSSGISGRQIPRLGQRADELLGVRLADIELPPVAVRKPRAQLAHGGPQIGVQLGVGHDYHVRWPRTCFSEGTQVSN